MADERGIGDNGGPPIEEPPLTPKLKLAHIQGILERRDLSSAQKCVGIGIVAAAERDGVAKLDTSMLQTFASARDRETVFRATKKLEQSKVIKRESRQGQRGEYRVLPQSVMEAIAEAYEELKSSRAKPDGTSGGTTDAIPTTNAVGFHPTTSETGRDEPVGFDPTSSQPGIENARARGLDNNITNTNNYPTDSEFGDRGYGGKPLLPNDAPAVEQVGLSLLAQKLDAIGEKLDKKRTKREADPDEPTPLEALEAFNLYNATALRCGLSQATTLTPERRKQLLARMKEHGGLDAWKRALANVERSAHMRGRNRDGWRADFDFLVRKARFTKVLEGGFGNGAGHADDDPDETPQQRMRRLMAEATSTEKRHGE